MIDLCKVLGVEEGEEFKFHEGKQFYKYSINRNVLLYYDENNKKWVESYKDMIINDLTNLKIIKLPKKKQFTDDELAIMRSFPKEFKWIARDRSNTIFVYHCKPTRNDDEYWEAKDILWNSLSMFKHLFNSIKWEDEEPVFIDDYVERGTE